MRPPPILKRLALEVRLLVANSIVTYIPSHTLRLLYYRSILRYTIGSRSAILMGTKFEAPGRFDMGQGSTVNQGCLLDSRGTLSIGDGVSISSGVVILTAEHDVHSRTFAGVEEPVHVGDHVFIGTRAIILPGVTLGCGVVVAAGAVVTRSIEPYTIVGGVPARKIGTRSTDLSYDAEYQRFLH